MFVYYITIVPSLPKISGVVGRGVGGVLVSEIWTKREVMKKLLRNRGLVERECPLRKRGVSKCFHQFSLRKACFHYYWIFFVW